MIGTRVPATRRAATTHIAMPSRSAARPIAGHTAGTARDIGEIVAVGERMPGRRTPGATTRTGCDTTRAGGGDGDVGRRCSTDGTAVRTRTGRDGAETATATGTAVGRPCGAATTAGAGTARARTGGRACDERPWFPGTRRVGGIDTARVLVVPTSVRPSAGACTAAEAASTAGAVGCGVTTGGAGAGAGDAGCDGAGAADGADAAAPGAVPGAATAGAGAGAGAESAGAVGGAVGGSAVGRAGRSESGSTYPCSSAARRIPRWTYGVCTSGEPLGPIVPTTPPSATASPFATPAEPRCVSVTA